MKILLSIMATMMLSGMALKAQSPAKGKKILVAYFSQSGNTRLLAGMIRQAADGDLFEIEPVETYPSDYNRLTDQAKAEIGRGYKPDLKTKVADMGQYDVIFIGSPCWWGTIAPPVASFLSGYDFSGKKIVPFMTHGGSRMGHSVEDIRKICPKSTVTEGLPVRGSAVKSAKGEIADWLQRIKVGK